MNIAMEHVQLQRFMVAHVSSTLKRIRSNPVAGSEAAGFVCHRKETAMSPKIKGILIWGLVIVVFILGMPLLQMAF